MKYKDYGIVDFIKDPFFVEWVSNPNSKSNEFWTKWISSHPEQMPIILQAQQFISSIEYDNFEPLQEEEYIEMFENVLKKKPGIYSRFSKISSPFSKRRAKLFGLKIAASISVILIGFAAYFWYGNGTAETTEPQQIVQYSKNNPVGQKSLITLPDGSKIKLNSESTLSYDSNFGMKDRVVELKGEAYFDITSNPSLPFIIRSGDLTTKVLGTSFNVRFYEGEDKIQVLVVKGEVSVSNGLDSSFILNPKDLLEYSPGNKDIKKSVCLDFKSVIGWKDGILSFNNESFNEVIKKIHRWYGVEIVLEEGFEVEGYYTGEYQNKSLERVMDGISFASEFNYTILNENKILIHEKI
jgi:transmembrane sensor